MLCLFYLPSIYRKPIFRGVRVNVFILLNSSYLYYNIELYTIKGLKCGLTHIKSRVYCTKSKNN